MTEPLAPQYDPSLIERPLYASWRERGLFHADAHGTGEPYVIQMPPPNVTAVLHAGHGLTYHNVMPVAAITEIVKLNIGHCIIARTIFSGLEVAVRERTRGEIGQRRARARGGG